MKKTAKIFSLILCAAMLFTACGSKVALTKEQAVKLADKDVLCLVNRDFETVAAGFNESIAKQVDAAALRQAWDSVAATAGDFISATGINYEAQKGLAVVTTTAEFENLGIIVTLSYDNTQRDCG